MNSNSNMFMLLIYDVRLHKTGLKAYCIVIIIVCFTLTSPKIYCLLCVFSILV